MELVITCVEKFPYLSILKKNLATKKERKTNLFHYILPHIVKLKLDNSQNGILFLNICDCWPICFLSHGKKSVINQIETNSGIAHFLCLIFFFLSNIKKNFLLRKKKQTKKKDYFLTYFNKYCCIHFETEFRQLSTTTTASIVLEHFRLLTDKFSDPQDRIR